MKNIRSDGAGEKWRNVIECDCKMSFEMLRRFENEGFTGIHRLKEQLCHERLLRPTLFLLFGFDDLFGEVAFAFADHNRIIAVHAEVGHDVLLPKLVVQVHQRNNPRFDKHQEREPQGNPLFSGSFQEMGKQFLIMNKCSAKLMWDV